jgi:hypothetical protein
MLARRPPPPKAHLPVGGLKPRVIGQITYSVFDAIWCALSQTVARCGWLNLIHFVIQSQTIISVGASCRAGSDRVIVDRHCQTLVRAVVQEVIVLLWTGTARHY